MPDPELDVIFAAGGPLAGALEDFAPRPEQLAMAQAVGRAMAAMSNLVVEAGTGTGKTFAYLVPALLSGRRVAISTGTRALQDQLFLRDLPVLARALGLPVRVAMLKGRRNYLCRYRLEQALPRDASEADQLTRIQRFAQHTRDGDVSAIDDVPEDGPIWSRVTSTTDNCLGNRCPAYDDCFVAAARRRAAAAELVIVNHHLLLADLALRDGGFGELLPAVEVVVVDEAHQVPDVAAQQFGRSLAGGQLQQWLQDLQIEAPAAGLDGVFRSDASALAEAVAAMQRVLGSSRRMAWSDVPKAAGEGIDRVRHHLETIADTLAPWSDSGAGLDALHRRARELAAFIDDFLAPDTNEELRWVDAHRTSFSLHRTPIEAAGALGAALTTRPCAWVFTSATLAVESRFDHFIARVGLSAAATETLRLDSPFDFRRHALLHLPPAMPAPSDPAYVATVCERALPLLSANPGGSFLLFTSHRALAAARDWLDGRIDRLLLAQGDGSRTTLLSRFRADGRAILLGTSSFWEGVDVRGPALSLVVIDKLPFAAPDEPLLRARLNWLSSQGRSGFSEHQLPAAVIALKQGVGRLIRDHTDRGVLMLCDPRLRQRGYGKRFLRSLPTMAQTEDVAEAVAFLEGDAGRGDAHRPEAHLSAGVRGTWPEADEPERKAIRGVGDAPPAPAAAGQPRPADRRRRS